MAAAGVGNRLNIRVEGRRIGEEVALAGAGDVTVTLETAGSASDIDVLVNGESAARVSVAAGVQLVQVKLPILKSSWVSARSRNSLTSPVYVLVGGQPVRASADDICYLRRWVGYLEDLVTSRRLYLYESEQEALAAYGEAVQELQRRFVEAGGGVCR